MRTVACSRRGAASACVTTTGLLIILVTVCFRATTALSPADDVFSLSDDDLAGASSNKITLPFKDGFVILDLPKNALRLPKQETASVNSRRRATALTRKRGQQLQRSQTSLHADTSRLPFLPNGGQSAWLPVTRNRKKNRNKNSNWNDEQETGSASSNKKKHQLSQRHRNTEDRMTLFIPTISQSESSIRVNSINEQLPSYQTSRSSGNTQSSFMKHMHELSPVFVPIDSNIRHNAAGDNLIPNDVLEQILAEVIPKIEEEDRQKSRQRGRNPDGQPYLRMMTARLLSTPRKKQQQYSTSPGESLLTQMSGYGSPAPRSPVQSIPRPQSRPAPQKYSPPAPRPQPVVQQQQQEQEPEPVQQQQYKEPEPVPVQQEEEPIVQQKEPDYEQEPEPPAQQEQEQEPEPQVQQQEPEPYQPPPPPPPVKGRPAPPAPRPAPTKGYSPPPAPRPQPPAKGYNPPPPPAPRPAAKDYPAPPRPIPPPVKGSPPPRPPPPAKGYNPPPAPRPAPRPAPTKGYSPPATPAPRPQPAKGYNPPPLPPPAKGRPAPPRPAPRPAPAKGIPPPPAPAVKGRPEPVYQRPIPAPAPVKGPPPPPPPPAPQQQQFEEPEPQPHRKSASSPAALQSPPSPLSTTTLLYDERATYTTPNPLRPTRGYDDPNADIGFDDETAAFSEEDMPAKMPLDDESDYAASPATSSRLRVDNSSRYDDNDDDRPHTVAPIRNLPLSPANRARTANVVRDGDADNYSDSAFETTVAPRSRWLLPGNAIQSSGSTRMKNLSYGDRLRDPVSAGSSRYTGDLGEEPSNSSDQKEPASALDSGFEDGSASIEYDDRNEAGERIEESEAPFEVLKEEVTNSTQNASTSAARRVTSYSFASSTPSPSSPSGNESN